MHSIYKQPYLPYLNVKLCPGCNELLPLDKDVCPKCSYNFSSRNIDEPFLIKKEEKPSDVVIPVVTPSSQPVINNEPIINDDKPNVQENSPNENSYNAILNDVSAYESKQEEPTIEESKQEDPVEESKHEEPMVEVPVEPVKKEKSIYCERCGSKIIGAQRFCGSCGAKVGKTICEGCNEIIDSNLPYCPFCGAKQESFIPEPIKEEVKQEEPENKVNEQPIYQQEPVVQTPVSQEPVPQAVNIYMNQSMPAPQEIEREEPKTIDATELVCPDSEPTPTETVNELLGDTLAEDYINMGRKRLFIIIQLLFTILVAAIMVMVPILTSKSFFTEMIPCFKGTSTETIMSQKDAVLEVIRMFKEGISLDLSKVSLLDENGFLFDGEKRFFIFSSMNTANNLIINLFAKSSEPAEIAKTLGSASYIVILGVYLLIDLSILVVVISSIVGMVKKIPFKGNAIGLLVWTLFAGCFFIYINKFFTNNKDVDSWLIYAFALIFILWFIIKIIFGKETKLYNKKREIELNKEALKNHK